MNISHLYNTLLANPTIAKPYRDLRKYYQSVGMSNEADAIGLLLREKFGDLPTWKEIEADANVSDNHQEQRSDNRKSD